MGKYIPKTASARQLQTGYRKILNEVKETGEPIVIVSNNKQEAVLITVDRYERLREIAYRTLWLEDGAFRALDTMVVDPVCAMNVRPGDTTPHYLHDGTTHWFCSQACRNDFADHPEGYLRGAGQAQGC